MHTDMPQMGRLLRDSREAKSLTQKEVAKRAQIALRTCIDIENNKRFPTLEVFYRILHVLDISADQIFWPERVTNTTEQEQVIREFLACSEREQRIISKTMRALIRVLREKDE